MMRDNASPGEMEVIEQSFIMGNLVLLPLSVQNEYSYRCEIDSYRQSSSRLSSGKDVSIVCVDFMDPITKPWVLCVDRGCVLTAKRKLSAILRILEFDSEEMFLKTPIAMRKAYGRMMNADGSVIATFCPHQRYTHHKGELFGMPMTDIQSFMKLPRYTVFSGPDQKIDCVFQTIARRDQNRDTQEAILKSIMIRVYSAMTATGYRGEKVVSPQSTLRFSNHPLNQTRLPMFRLVERLKQNVTAKNDEKKASYVPTGFLMNNQTYSQIMRPLPDADIHRREIRAAFERHLHDAGSARENKSHSIDTASTVDSFPEQGLMELSRSKFDVSHAFSQCSEPNYDMYPKN